MLFRFLSKRSTTTELLNEQMASNVSSNVLLVLVALIHCKYFLNYFIWFWSINGRLRVVYVILLQTSFVLQNQIKLCIKLVANGHSHHTNNSFIFDSKSLVTSRYNKFWCFWLYTFRWHFSTYFLFGLLLTSTSWLAKGQHSFVWVHQKLRDKWEFESG